MKIKKLFMNALGCAIFLASFPVLAANVWLFENTYVEDVSTYEHTVVIRFTDTINTATQSYDCNVTRYAGTTRLFTSDSGTRGAVVGIALAAQAQGLPVDVMIDLPACDQSANYKNTPTEAHPDANLHDGMGLWLRGIRIHRELYQPQPN